MHLLLVRHAQTHSNVARALDTALPGADLTELGEQQVADLGRTLAGERIDAVYSSPALRARRTAEALATPRGLTPVERAGLVEVAAGEWEMSTDEQHWQGYGAMVGAWFDGDLTARLPGGEAGEAVVARVDEVIAEISALGCEQAAVVSHGGTIRVWSVARAGASPELARAHPLANTGVVRVSGDVGNWRVEAWDGVAT